MSNLALSIFYRNRTPTGLPKSDTLPYNTAPLWNTVNCMKSNNFFLAVSLTISACFILACMDALAKGLMPGIQPLQVTWARFTFHTLIIVVFFLVRGESYVFRSNATKTQLLRGLCVVGVNSAMYMALMTISLAEATAIMYLSPVLVTLLAGTLLGEKITRNHLIASAVGFLGVLVIIRPGLHAYQPGLVLSLVSAFALALYILLTRKVAAVDSNRTSLFYAAIVGAVLLSLIVPFFWTTPSPLQWLQLILMGLLGAIGHLLLIKAYRLQAASELSPWLNSQVVIATVFSFVFFKDSLDAFFFIGASLIIGAGLMLFWRGHRDKLLNTR